MRKIFPLRPNLGNDPVIFIEKQSVPAIRGIITDNLGKTPSKAYVYIYRKPDKTSESNLFEEVFTSENIVTACESGKDGEFCFEDLAKGNYAVCVNTPYDANFEARTICKMVELNPKKKPSNRELKFELEAAK